LAKRAPPSACQAGEVSGERERDEQRRCLPEQTPAARALDEQQWDDVDDREVDVIRQQVRRSHGKREQGGGGHERRGGGFRARRRRCGRTVVLKLELGC
jgi:hypothetical protein